MIRKEIIEHLECELTCWNVNEVFYKKWIAWLEKQGKEEYALKSSKHEDVYKFMEYIEKRAKSYEFNLPNRGYDIYAFAKDILIWLEKQGQSTFDKCKQEGDRIVENSDGTHFNISQLERVAKAEPKFNVGDTMRTLQEANDGYTDGMPVIVSIDNEYYHCTNELIAIKDQDDYEYPPINVKQKHNDKPKFHEGERIGG